MSRTEPGIIRIATALFGVFLVAVFLALAVTVYSVSMPVKLLAAGVVSPILILGVICVIYCMKGRAWGFAGAFLLGVVGVVLRVIISAQPNLEVGGGLPVWVSATYVFIGAATALSNLWSFAELRKR